MPTPSQKLGLALPSTPDAFSTADIKANWEKIDAAPGSHICTSSTRPTWTAAQAGRKIIETDTRLEWLWTGSAWDRLAPVGLLKKSDGSFAIAERTNDFETSANNMVKVVSVTGVVVPAGNRPIKAEVVWQRAKNSTSGFSGAIFRSNTNNSGPKMAFWRFSNSGDAANAGGGTFFGLERAGLTPGTYDFSFQVSAFLGGTTTLYAAVDSPASIVITEL